MHLRRARICRQYGQSELAIINWRILFEEKYLSEIKCLLHHFEDVDRRKQSVCGIVYSATSRAPAASAHDPSANLNIPHLPEEAPSSGEHEAAILLPPHNAESEDIFPSMTPRDLEEDEKTMSIDGNHGMGDDIKMDDFRTKPVDRGDPQNDGTSSSTTSPLRFNAFKSINRSDDSLKQRIMENTHCPPSSRQLMEHRADESNAANPDFDSNRYPETLDVGQYLNKYRSDLECTSEQFGLSETCKSLRSALRKEEYLQQRQELLVPYEERLGVVIVLFHWFIATNRYDLKSNVYSSNDIAVQLSSKKVKHYYLSHHVVTQIQRKFDALVLDSRNQVC